MVPRSQVVGEALKGVELIAQVMESLGYECNPPAGEARTDIIQAQLHLAPTCPIFPQADKLRLTMLVVFTLVRCVDS